VNKRIINVAPVVIVMAGLMAAAGAARQNPAPAQARGGPPPVTPDPSTQEPAHRTTFEQVNTWTTSLSNWGRWGKDDERGSLNIVTPEITKHAMRLARDGVVVSLAKFAETEKQADNFNFGETKHEMVTRTFALDKIS
jgi:hypothetical protein